MLNQFRYEHTNEAKYILIVSLSLNMIDCRMSLVLLQQHLFVSSMKQVHCCVQSIT